MHIIATFKDFTKNFFVIKLGRAFQIVCVSSQKNEEETSRSIPSVLIGLVLSSALVLNLSRLDWKNRRDGRRSLLINPFRSRVDFQVSSVFPPGSVNQLYRK